MLKICSEELGKVGKVLALKHQDLSLMPQGPAKNQVGCHPPHTCADSHM